MGNLIKYHREYYGLSIRELARRVGISHTEMGLIENNERVPSVYTAFSIAKELNTSVYILFPMPELGNYKILKI